MNQTTRSFIEVQRGRVHALAAEKYVDALEAILIDGRGVNPWILLDGRHAAIFSGRRYARGIAHLSARRLDGTYCEKRIRTM